MKLAAQKIGGFTLVELLSALAVFVVLAFIVLQVMNTASRATLQSDKMIDTAAQVRLVFGRLGEDLSALVKRADVPFQAQNAAIGATNLLLFVSNVTSAPASLTTANRDASILAYEVAVPAGGGNAGADGNQRPCLIRAGMAIPWTTTGYFGLDGTGLPVSFSGTPTTVPAALLPANTAQNSDFDILAPGVIRLIVGFQLYPDDQPATLADGTAVANCVGQVVYSPPVRSAAPYGGATASNPAVKVIDVSRISALVVGLVVIDLNSLRLLNATQVTALGSAFTVPAVSAQATINTLPLPVSYWEPKAETPSLLPSSVPLPALQSLRVFQRFYPITPYASHP